VSEQLMDFSRGAIENVGESKCNQYTVLELENF
jgi:hypothetical protein